MCVFVTGASVRSIYDPFKQETQFAKTQLATARGTLKHAELTRQTIKHRFKVDNLEECATLIQKEAIDAILTFYQYDQRKN